MLYKKLPLKVLRLKGDSGSFEERVIKYFQEQKFVIEDNRCTAVKGTPDLFISNKKENFYVEIKSLGDSLRLNQIEWFLNHPNKKILVVIEGPPIKPIVRKKGIPRKRVLCVDKSRNRWSKEDIEKLREIFPLASFDKLKNAFPDRSPSSIRSKAYSLELRTTLRWIKEDISKLIKLYPTAPWNELIRAFPNRNIGGIKNMASKLKIMRENRWTEDEIEKLKKIYPTTWNKLKDAFPNRTKEGIKNKAVELGLKTHHFWTIDEKRKLREIYLIASSEELKNTFPNRTKDGIRMVAYKLGLKKDKVISCSLWTEKELEKLRELYPMVSRNELTKEFPERTYNAIQGMASELGLKKMNHWTKNEVKKLEESYSIIPLKKLQKDFPNRTCSSLSAKANKFGLKSYHSIKIETVRRIKEKLAI